MWIPYNMAKIKVCERLHSVTFSASSPSKPAGEAEPCFPCRRYFMPETVGKKGDQCAACRFYFQGIFGRIRPEAQQAAIGIGPVFVEIKDDRQRASVVILETVEMPAITRARRVEGKVQFDIEQAEEKVLVDGESQGFQFRQRVLQCRSGMRFIDPEHLIAANFSTDLGRAAPNAGAMKIAVGLGSETLASQAGGFGRAQKVGNYAPARLGERGDDFIQ